MTKLSPNTAEAATANILTFGSLHCPPLMGYPKAMGWFSTKQAFLAEWWDIVLAHVPYAARLTADEKQHYQQLIATFVGEKNWQGCNGLEITEEMRVAIAAMACLLILNLKDNLFHKVLSILVYPTTVVTPERKLGSFEISNRPVAAGQAIVGEAQLHGPVILVWDEIENEARSPNTKHNVVYHEFAHQLDMLDGSADGTPPLENRAAYKRWIEICAREFLGLKKAAERGKPTLLDRYGAVNEAEFFAVATELFFDRAVDMATHYPELYGVLKDYYRQDPATR